MSRARNVADIMSGAGSNVVFEDGFGLDFGSVAGGGATGSVLDDYEEGTWTPTATGVTFDEIKAARYTKIGNLVFIDLRVSWSSTDNNSDTFEITLPFMESSSSNTPANTGIVFYSGTSLFSGRSISVHIGKNRLVTQFYDTGGGSFSSVKRNAINGSYDWLVSFSYSAA